MEMIKKRDLNKIRRNLPRGWRTQLAEKTGKSLSTVTKVLVKERHNPAVVMKAIEMCNLPEEAKIDLRTKLTTDK